MRKETSIEKSQSSIIVLIPGPPISHFTGGLWGINTETDSSSGHLSTKLTPGLFSRRSASSFACFLPQCASGFPYRCVLGSSPRLTVKPGGGASFLRPAHPASSRYQRGAQGSALRRGQPTHTASSSSSFSSSSSPSSSSCTEAGLLCRGNSTDSQLLLSLSKPRLHPPSAGCTQNRPAVLSGRPDGKSGCLCGGVYAFPCARNHDTSAFELLFCCFRCTASICTRFILLHCDVCVKSDLIYCKCVMSSLKCP